jgi:hypothetical protein
LGGLDREAIRILVSRHSVATTLRCSLGVPATIQSRLPHRI